MGRSTISTAASSVPKKESGRRTPAVRNSPVSRGLSTHLSYKMPALSKMPAGSQRCARPPSRTEPSRKQRATTFRRRGGIGALLMIDNSIRQVVIASHARVRMPFWCRRFHCSVEYGAADGRTKCPCRNRNRRVSPAHGLRWLLSKGR